jgi:Kef-type K+ transport system membrane component KefB
MFRHGIGPVNQDFSIVHSEEPYRTWQILARNVIREERKMKPNLSMVFLGALVGTPAMSVAMYVVAPLVGVRVDIVAMLGEMLGWRMGMLVHILNGVIVFPLVFTFLFYRFLPGSPAAKGMAFGTALWLTSQLIVMPIMGTGLLSSHAGGMRAAAASLVGHVVYGYFIGLFPMLAQEDPFPGNEIRQPLSCKGRCVSD